MSGVVVSLFDIVVCFSTRFSTHNSVVVSSEQSGVHNSLSSAAYIAS